MEPQPSPQERAEMSNSAVAVIGKTMRWNDDLDRQLLLAIVSQVPGYDVLRLVDMERIAETLGPNCTARAVAERLKKLKKNANVRMDETAPHVIGSTCKMEAEFRAKREADFAAVQPRKPRTMVKTLPESAGDNPKPGTKKTDAGANAATIGRSRNKKGTARIIKKGKVKATGETFTEEETGDASNAGEDLSMAETSHTGVALNAGKAHDHSHKSNHRRHNEEAIDIDTPEPSQPTKNKRQQAPAFVIQLESDSESSETPPVKKRRQEKDKVKDFFPTSTAVKRQRKHTSNPASREGED